MERDSRKLLIFSFISFLCVFIFGTLRAMGPFKNFFNDTKAMDNVMLFHSHFDQLCWLGAATLGIVFYCLRQKYQGSLNAIKYFTYLYITGTLMFSFAFLVRALGIAMNVLILQKLIFAILVSISGALFMVLIVTGFFILNGFKKVKAA